MNKPTSNQVSLWRWLSPWRRDSRNPARRYCRDCGTQQDLYGWQFEDGFYRTGWEYIIPIRQCRRNHRV